MCGYVFTSSWKAARSRKDVAVLRPDTTVAVARRPVSREISPATSPSRSTPRRTVPPAGSSFCTTSSPASTRKRPGECSPSTSTFSPGCRARKVKRCRSAARSDSGMGWKSGEVAIRFRSMRFCAKVASTCGMEGKLLATALRCSRRISNTSMSDTAVTVAVSGAPVSSDSSPKMEPPPRKPSVRSSPSAVRVTSALPATMTCSRSVASPSRLTTSSARRER